MIIRTTKEKMAKVVLGQLDTTGNTNLTVTGAKASYRGGGWWLIAGYSYDGRDVKAVVLSLNN